MKKIISLLLALLMVATVLVSCNQPQTPDDTTPADTTPDSETEPDTEKPKGGCGSAMLSCAAVLGAAGAVALKKKKGHG